MRHVKRDSCEYRGDPLPFRIKLVGPLSILLERVRPLQVFRRIRIGGVEPVTV